MSEMSLPGAVCRGQVLDERHRSRRHSAIVVAHGSHHGRSEKVLPLVEAAGCPRLPKYTSTRYSGLGVTILSFSDSTVEDFFITGRTPRRAGWSGVAKVARRKLDMLDYAHRLDDLRSPPGNRLEALKRDMAGFHSIRINDQWRVIFR